MTSINEAIQQDKFREPLEKVIVNILYTHSWLSGIHNTWLKPYELSIQQYNILRILRGQHPKPASVNKLIERMVDKSSNSSRLVEKLRIKELVERTVCQNDRRQVDVRITQKGLKQLNELDEKFPLLLSKVGKLTKAEAEQLSTLLDKLRL